MRSLSDTLFLAQYAATLFMTGLIWFVQIVHYPLFATVENRCTRAGFREYGTRHANRTSFVVFPAMAVELLSGLAAIFPALRPAFLPWNAAVASAVMVILLWVSTGVVQVPLHNRIASDPGEQTIRRLVMSNWLRTVLWTARTVLLSVALSSALRFSS